MSVEPGWYVLLTISRYQGGVAFHQIGPLPSRDLVVDIGSRWFEHATGDRSWNTFYVPRADELPPSNAGAAAQALPKEAVA